MDNDKRVVLVTGASRGIGEEIASRFNELGDEVISPSRDELDLASQDSVKSFVANFDTEISVLVNNAGINIVGTVDGYRAIDLEQMLQTNLVAAFELCKLAIRSNRLRAICNVASVWSERSYPERAVYSMTKSGLLGLTRGLAQELGSRNIVVNAVSPGFIETEMTAANISKDRRNELYKNIPLGRFGNPGNIANVVAFLCSSDNQYITGQNIIADGGFLS